MFSILLKDITNKVYPNKQLMKVIMLHNIDKIEKRDSNVYDIRERYNILGSINQYED